jgi:hypothetical protein
MKNAFFASALVLSIVGGCSGGSEPGPSTGKGTSLATTVAFCKAWAEAACNEEVVSICDEGADGPDGCIASQEAWCRDLIPVGYDPKNAQACLDAVKAAYVDADLTSEELDIVLNLAEPCDQLIKGPTAEGGRCVTSTDCNTLDGLRCVIKSGQTEGTCQIPNEVGGGFGCSGAEQVCAEGFYCDGDNCLAQKDLGDSCAFDAECDPAHLCEIDATADPPAGECVERKDTGDTCAADAECQSHLCAIPRGASSGVCVSRVRLSPDSAFCQDLR